MGNFFKKAKGTKGQSTIPFNSRVPGDEQGSAVVRPAGQSDEPPFDITRVWLALVESKKLIMGVAVVVTVLCLVYTMLSKMEFRVESSLYLGDAQTSGR